MFCLPEEEKIRIVRRRARLGYGNLSLHVLQLFGMVWTPYVMTVIRKEVPRREVGAPS